MGNKQFKLIYFNIRGRAEVARLIMAAGDQSYEDKRIEFSEWTVFKPSTPFGFLPILEVRDGSNSFVIAESLSISRFLANKCKLAGRNDIERAQADMYVDQINEMFNQIVKLNLEKDEYIKKKLLQKLENESMCNLMRCLEDQMLKNKTGYLVGSCLTWADLFLMNTLDFLGDNRLIIFDNFPLIKDHDNRIRSIPRIAKWIAKRPKTKL